MIYKKEQKGFANVFLISALAVVILLAGGVRLTRPEITTPPELEKISSPLEAKLLLSGKPLLNTPVKLTLKVKSIILPGNTPGINFPNTTAKIDLPDGFELVSGDLEWQGDLGANEERSIEAMIKSTRTGYYKLIGHVNSKKDDGSSFGSADIIYVEVTPNDVIIGSKPENNWFEPAQGMAIPLAENNDKIESELIISRAPELNKEFTITYSVMHQDGALDGGYSQMSLMFPPKAFKIVSVEFPEGGKTYNYGSHYGSQISWQGNLKKGRTAKIKATLRVINTGWGEVYGNLAGNDGQKFVQDVKIADLYVDKYLGNFTIK